MEQTQTALPKQIGPYSILGSLGKGGMGEVYLAEDPSCKRKVAIKRIRPELKANKTIQNRFLREAHVASALSHPSIVPILSLEQGPDIYYTMPFVEGDTLKQILRGAKELEKKSSAYLPHSIPSLARIFLQICQAVAYTHSKGILHRDLKPENIIIGKYGEVMILDWGIADFIDQIGKEEPLSKEKGESMAEGLTKPGKITGTLAYMAPERLLGQSSSIQTDLYALGVILYQMLTLTLPFQRKTLASFRKSVHKEEFISPIDMSPYRDIPHQLSEVCRKCLSAKKTERYQSVEEIASEISCYIEGRPEWFLVAEPKLKRKEDWQFQQSILLAKNIAITRSLDVTQWAELMISKSAFAPNLRIEAEIRFEKNSHGLGFLFNIHQEQHGVDEGYCLWIEKQGCKLFRNNVQMVQSTIDCNRSSMKIAIEKVDDHIEFYVSGKLVLKFSSYLPLAGNHIGLLYKDGNFDLKRLKIYDASHNAMVGCLAVPNALFSHKMYDAALQEYRRIGSSFPGRMEGREALFRAGLTLIEKGRCEGNDQLYHLALKEFEKLYKTPGAPLEYLGKSFVYEALQDAEEEAKCLELALRKFPNHPLFPMLKEHIVYRMHESSLNNRQAAYMIILLAIRHIPDLLVNNDTSHLIDSLESNWEQLPFIQPSEKRLSNIAIQLAFWLAKVPILVELAHLFKDDEILFSNALSCLQELEAIDALNKFLPKKPKRKKTLIIWKVLLEKNFDKAQAIFDKFSALIQDESSPLHFSYGTYLYMTQGKKAGMAHFQSVLETRYPSTTALPSLFLTNRLSGWDQRAFWWEKKELHRQITLFHQCIEKK